MHCNNMLAKVISFKMHSSNSYNFTPVLGFIRRYCVFTLLETTFILLKRKIADIHKNCNALKFLKKV